MQTAAQKANSIRFGSGVLKANGVNLGLLDNAELEIAWAVIAIKAHNGQLPIKKKPDTVKFNAELYEIDLVNLAALDSHGVLSNITGAPTTITAEILKASGTWGVGEVLWYDHTNVTSVTNVKNGATTLTAGTDYKLVYADGKYGVANITASPVTLTGIGINSTYVYTLVTMNKTIISDLAKLVSTFELKFENTDSDGKKFTLTIPQAYQSNNTALKFVSDDATDEVMKVPFEFDSIADGSNQLLIIEDEQSV